MTSRERVRKVIDRQMPDKVPLDLGSTLVTGISASAYSKLRQALGMEPRPVKVSDPYQILAEVEDEFRGLVGVDTIGLELPVTLFGFRNENWKPWRLFDGTDVLVSGHFTTTTDEDGGILLHPAGDRSAPPSARMPKDGFYFDTIVRQGPLDMSKLDPKEFAEDQYSVYTEEDLRFLEGRAEELHRNTSLSIVGCFWQGGFGDIALVPGPAVKYPRGIRDPVEWYIAHIEHPDYITGIFELQCEIALENLKLYRQAVGDKIDVIVISGTDFGSQRGPFISPDMYREMYMPFHKRVNDWVHENTNWKTFFHTCGSVVDFLDDFAAAGIDILNPVQCSAEGMAPARLKENYGDRFIFWGGGVDTQKTLPFGAPDEVREEVVERVRIFGQGGGYVFNAIHNIQQNTPVENLVALFEAFNEARGLA